MVLEKISDRLLVLVSDQPGDMTVLGFIGC